MSIENKVLKGVSWLATFKFSAQALSWFVTIIVSRILVPDDYGLMAMSTIITGYAEMFSELGLGNAIIQRSSVTQKEKSSLFWFTFGMSLILAFLCFPLSHLTAYIMKEPKVIALTQVVAIMFITNGLKIVPLATLKKEMDFKKIGFMEMVATVASCLAMLIMAHAGWGVWTLLSGRIIRAFVHLIFIYYYSRWLPDFYFKWKQAISFIRFGIIVSIGGSLYYVWEKSDRFFAGRTWNAQVLGYYTFALQLAAIPTEKIVSLINQVTYPALSKLQNNPVEFNNLYLNITKMMAVLVFPLFVGGFLLGDDIVKVVLNEKWYPSIMIFRLLCLSQIAVSLNTINSLVHNAKGKPMLPLFFQAVAAIIMPFSFFIATRHDLNSMAYPWLLAYTVLCIGWAFFTVHSMGIGVIKYLTNFYEPFFATVVMATVILFFKTVLQKYFQGTNSLWIVFTTCILTGTVTYLGFFLLVFPKFSMRFVNKFLKRSSLQEYSE